MVTVALIGPDGSGKSTICRQLKSMLPLPIKYIYMGIACESGNLLLPTTRLILAFRRLTGWRIGPLQPPTSNRTRPHPKNFMRRLTTGLRSSLLLLNLMAEEWFRQALVWYYRRRGYLVLFDRHFIADYYAFDFANVGASYLFKPPHSLLLERFYPRPDLVIFLDAPAEVLFARKGESTLESLALMRQGYMQLGRQFRSFAIVDTTQPEEKVSRDVADLIWNFYKTQMGGKAG